MYNAQTQTNADIHDALALITSIVGGGYRPQAIIAGYLGAVTLKHLADVEQVHVAQATIFSQFNIGAPPHRCGRESPPAGWGSPPSASAPLQALSPQPPRRADYGDGDGGSPYPYFPSTQHYLKPAQGESDKVDVVVLDGWTVDFLAARRDGFADGFNSRMGVGPIETIRDVGPVLGAAEQMHATAQHFDTGFALNAMAFVTSIWEISLPINVSFLTSWLSAVRGRWPDTQLLTHGEFGMRWRAASTDDTAVVNDYNYTFVEIGSGIAGSDADKEISFFVNRAFRLVLLRNLSDVGGAGLAVDFTRYDLAAAEPANLTRSWNIMNELNMKESRGAVDAPVPLELLSREDRDIIRAWLPGLPV